MAKVMNTKSFILKANIIHNNKYKYIKSVYTKAKDKLIVTCPFHGDFTISPNNHYKPSGCPTCGKITQTKSRTQSISLFLKRAKEVHGNLYTYANIAYTNIKAKISVTCNKHGDFLITPDNFLTGRGCNKCGIESYTKTTSTFIIEANNFHNNLYTYENTKYINSYTKVNITCKVHGDFLQNPNQHIRGHGCPICANYTLNLKEPCTLYYLRVTDPILNITGYKIGITGNTVNKRYRKIELDNICVLKEIKYSTGKKCLLKEQEILKACKKYKYNGPNLLIHGNTELFTIDITKIFKGDWNE